MTFKLTGRPRDVMTKIMILYACIQLILCTYIYIYIERERERTIYYTYIYRERESAKKEEVPRAGGSPFPEKEVRREGLWLLCFAKAIM